MIEPQGKRLYIGRVFLTLVTFIFQLFNCGVTNASQL